ncbi:type II toxin-antitoxin system MqsA family antitoxin [Desulfobacterales bacterium HSG2]|nr:type II toxin-antitoxin system MqsA family antitoxin [Desulfobacterales bacterium HSG2]
MPRVYSRCHFCGGDVSEKKVTVDYRWGNELIAIIDNVPAGVCPKCGEQYFRAEIVKEMEKLAHSGEEPVRMIEIPYREMAIAS